MSDEKTNSIKMSNYSITPDLGYYGSKRRVEFNGSCLKRDKITFNHGKVVNIYIVYEINKSINISDYSTLENCLFGAIRLTKNVDIGYGTGFDRKGSYSIGDDKIGRNVIIFGIDMSSYPHVDNKGKDILILEKGPTQGLGEHSLTAEKLYSINYTRENTKFCLSLHHNGVLIIEC